MDLYLKHLSLVNFKNYPQAEADLCAGVNCFTGLNGEGKTNLLDAVYYLSFCKSYFNPVDTQNIRKGEEFFVIQGLFDRKGEEEEIYCGVKAREKKVFRRNKKDYSRLSEHIGLIPLVMISPSDTELISGGSEARRRFIDGVISQYDKLYLEDLLHYNKALQQRNALLKQRGHAVDPEFLEVYDVQLSDFGMRIIQKREAFLLEFLPFFSGYYRKLCANREEPGVNYHISSGAGKSLAEALRARTERDRALEYTSVGPHRDDLLFVLDGLEIKKYGSQGQQKSFVIALRLAQYDFIREKIGFTPLLLLDDIYDRLDETRAAALMQLVSEPGFGQIFITDTHPGRIPALFAGLPKPIRTFAVEHGKLNPVTALQHG